MAARPGTPSWLAEATSTGEPYAREWLAAQAAGGYVDYEANTGQCTLPPARAAALTDPTSPAYLPGFFQITLGTVHDIDGVLKAARNQSGLGWHEHHTDVHDGCERFFHHVQRPPGQRAATGTGRRDPQAGTRRFGR